MSARSRAIKCIYASTVLHSILLCQIAEFLPITTIFELGRVCRNFHDTIRDHLRNEHKTLEDFYGNDNRNTLYIPLEVYLKRMPKTICCCLENLHEEYPYGFTPEVNSFLSRLQMLDISGPLTNAELMLTKPVSLRIVSMHITDSVFLHKGFKNLQTLHINGCTQFTDKAFEYVTNAPLLHTLDISGCFQHKITDEGFAHLGRLQYLHTLHMVACSQETITDKGLQALKHLQYLDISYCNQSEITDEAFCNMSGLKTLSMVACSQPAISEAAFRYLPNLRTLDMSDCYQENISGDAFKYLELEELTMDGCNQEEITNESFAALPNLRRLSIERCSQLDYEKIKKICTNLPALALAGPGRGGKLKN